MEILFNRRKLNRERLEIYLVHLFLAYRPLILSGGVLLLLISAAVMILSSRLGLFILLPAIILLLLGGSFKVVLFTSRIGAWIGTLGRDDD